MSRAVPTVVMRGGTSKGLYFLRDDLPEKIAHHQVRASAPDLETEKQRAVLGQPHR